KARARFDPLRQYGRMDRIKELEERLLHAATELRERLRERERAVQASHADTPTPGWGKTLHWLLRGSPKNLIALPFIYGMAVPLVLLHLTLEIYQRVCFPLFRIAVVRPSDHFIVDRHRLRYLNPVERLNCGYCGYANGLMSFAREIIARTEQYWCPIKHSQQISTAHARYARYADFGDAGHYPEVQARLRAELDAERSPPTTVDETSKPPPSDNP
ncbi:MAG TPA: hypothetical protein P5171_15060, partial [Xanthomonadaceae bacterium]|nr:hypothetical protein [Xanthomonadaceae bacterium]